MRSFLGFESAKHVIKYLLASILVGVILGVSGAFAAQGFRLGIVLISDFVANFFFGKAGFFISTSYRSL